MRLPFWFIVTLILYLASGCVPPKTFVDSHQEKRINQINKELEHKVVKVRTTDRKEFRAIEVKLTADSLLYTRSDKKQGLPLNKIISITASPKIGVAEILGIPLFAFGTYLFITMDDESNNYNEGRHKLGGGIAAYILGIITVIDGSNAESERYYFKKR